MSPISHLKYYCVSLKRSLKTPTEICLRFLATLSNSFQQEKKFYRSQKIAFREVKYLKLVIYY